MNDLAANDLAVVWAVLSRTALGDGSAECQHARVMADAAARILWTTIDPSQREASMEALAAAVELSGDARTDARRAEEAWDATCQTTIEALRAVRAFSGWLALAVDARRLARDAWRVLAERTPQ